MSEGDSSSSVSAVRELLARVEAMTIDQRCPSVRRAPAGLSVPQPSPATLESSRNSRLGRRVRLAANRRSGANADLLSDLLQERTADAVHD